MSSGHLKQTNLTVFLPKGIKDSLVCHTLVNSQALPDGPDIITCHANGCLYEIKNKKVIRSLKLNETATTVRWYCLPENGKTVLFYLVLTTGFRLLVIRRSNKYLKIVKDQDGVKDIQVYDFQCLGFPQIKILNEGRSVICKFPVESNEREEYSEDSIIKADSLIDEFQILNRYIDDLTEEYNQLRKMCFSNTSAGFENIFVDSVMFSLPLDEVVQHKLTVCDKWLKVIGNNLILGMKLHNTGTEVIRDIEITINHKKIKDYAYSFFPSNPDVSGYLFSSQPVSRSAKPGDQLYAVVAFQVPEFFSESEFVVPFCIFCSDLLQTVVTDTFHVNVQAVACGTAVGLEEMFTVEDLLAVKLTKSEIRVKIRADDLKDCTMESILTGNLGFKRIKHVKDKLFYCTSTYLKEVFVSFRHITVNPSVWKLLVFSSDRPRLYFLINALYDFLPENAEILCDED